MNILFLLKPKCNVAYLNQSDTIRQGLEKMRHHGYTAIPVIDDNGIYVGTITEGDFLWNILSLQKPQVQTETSTLQYLEQYGIANLTGCGDCFGVGAGEEGAVGEFLIFIRIGGWFRNHGLDEKLPADSDKMVK